jgi:outer membrane receptor protein involved in Fe transport
MKYSGANRRLALWTSASLAPFAILGGGAAHAADAAGPPAADNSKGRTTIEELVVTAQKRTENILTVPISIAALTQQSMDEQGVKNVSDLIRVVPGVSLIGGGTTGQVRVSIRGISSGAGSATTGIYLDETPINGRETGTVYPAVFDLDRVEVLRGPQGTLFGAGSEGGTVRFITPAPSLTTYSVYARGELAFTERGSPSEEAGLAVGGPVNDKLGFRASFWTRHDGGYIDRYNFFTRALVDKDTNSKDTYSARLALLWKPTDSLTVTPSVFYQKSNQADSDTWWTDVGTYNTVNNIPQPTSEQLIVPSVSIEYEFPHFSVKSISSFLERHQDGTNQFFHSSKQQLFYAQVPDYALADVINRRQHNFTQEIRITSTDTGPFTFVGGLFFEHDKEDYDEIEVEPLVDQLYIALTGKNILQNFGVPLLPGFVSYHDQRGDVEKETAVFAEASYNFTEKLKLTVGGRYSSANFRFAEGSNGPFGVNGKLQSVNSSGQSTEHPFTPKVNLAYTTETALLYGTIAKGYRIGGANAVLPNICTAQLATLGVTGTAPPYQSDSVISYEIGGKKQFDDRRLQVEASVYKIDWSRIQGVIPLNTCALSYTGNFGRAVSQGFDLHADFRPIAGLSLEGSIGYTDAHYTQTVFVPGSLTQMLAKSGDELLNTPKWKASVGAQYTWPIFSGMDAYARADANYSSAYFRTYSATVNGFSPLIYNGGEIITASLRAGVRKDHIDAAVFVQNLFDNDTPLYSTVGTTANTFGASALAIRNISLRPRTFGATVTYRY